MVGYVWPHRRHVTIGILAALLAAALNAVSIGGILPVLQILIGEEGLHGWVAHTIAEKRTGARLAAYESRPSAGSGDGGPVGLVVEGLREGGPLGTAGLAPLDLIVALDGEPLEAAAWFPRLADLPAGAVCALTVRRQMEDAAGTVDCRVQLGGTPVEWRLIRSAVNFIPAEVTRQDRIRTLVWILAFVTGLVLLLNVTRFISEYFVALGVYRALMDLRRDLYHRVLMLPMSFFTRGTGDIASRFVQDAQEIQRGLLALLGKFVREPLRVVAFLALALWLDWRITLTMLVAGPAAMLIFTRIGRSVRKANQRLLLMYGRMIDALTTSLHAIGVVKAYTTETAERRRLWRIDEQVFRQQVRITMLQAALRPMLEVVAIVAISIAIVWLGKQVVSGQIRPAQFGTLVFVLAMLFDPLRKLADVYARIARAAAGAERIFSVMDRPAEAELFKGTTQLPPLAERIKFRDVVFTYPGAPAPALSRVNLTVAKGEVLAIVGPNGSGKTTLINLLPRFFDPDEGEVLFDGVDIRTATLKSLRQQISLVTQDPVIFEATLAENIRYGTPEASRDDVMTAARRAHADEFIEEKEQGYETLVGEWGSTLSGGQRQRLAIARAVLRNAPIFIFDEATSQIDADSERKIQETLREFSRGRTTLIVAHRLSTIRFASRIAVMDRGRIIDSGGHEELLERSELYATLCRTQLAE
jgi:ABC-type multidrug transport system fused ATPase/permease subunit